MPLRNRLGIAIAERTYAAARALLSSPRWQRAYNFGARPQRLLWASTGTKDPQASDILYVKALAAPFTVNTMPEGTLKALATHTELGKIMATDGGDCEEVLAEFAKAGVDVNALAARLQDEGAKSFVGVVERADGGHLLEERHDGEGIGPWQGHARTRPARARGRHRRHEREDPRDGTEGAPEVPVRTET